MSLTNYIYQQVAGFQKAGKKIIKPKNDAEKAISKAIAVIMLITAIGFYGYILKIGLNIPLRIHIRAWIYLIPWLSFVVMFYKGISISWIIKGILKYWMVPLMLVLIYLILMNMVYVIFFGSDYHKMLVLAGIMSIYSGYIYLLYFWKSASKSWFYYFPALFMVGLISGGIAMILWGTGVLDWFVVDVLGW